MNNGINEELLDCLYEITSSAAYTDPDTLITDSMAISDYADALRLLAKHGKFRITKEAGRRVFGYWACNDPQKTRKYSACGGCSPEGTSDYASCKNCKFNDMDTELEQTLEKSDNCLCKTLTDSDLFYRFLTNHHESCPNAPKLKYAMLDLLKALVTGMESWGSDCDGIHPEVWEAYKKAKCCIGEFNWKEKAE
jgi:hypothetical protein